MLRVELESDPQPVRAAIERALELDRGGPWRPQLDLAIDDALKRLIAPSGELDVRVDLKLKSDAATPAPAFQSRISIVNCGA